MESATYPVAVLVSLLYEILRTTVPVDESGVGLQ